MLGEKLENSTDKIPKNKNKGGVYRKTKGGTGAGGKSNARARSVEKITGRILYIFFTKIPLEISSKVDITKYLYIIKSWQMQEVTELKMFEKRKSVLKYLGKNEKDVRALNRMIERWEVEFDWTYYLVKRHGVSEETQPKQTTPIENFLPPEKTISSKVDTDLQEELEMEKINTKYYKDWMYAVKDVYDKVIEEVFNLCYAKHEVRAKAREVIAERLSHIEQLQ